MSKNPFRRQQLDTPRGLDLPTDAPASSESLEGAPLASDPRRGSKTKRVRIATPPPLSPDSVETFSYDDSPPIQRLSDESHPGSPPPESLSDSSDSTIEPAADDPFGRASDDGELFANEEVAYNTRRNSDMTSTPPHPVPPVGNPFHKTLATMEAEMGQTDLPVKPSEPSSDTAEEKSQRTVMDVDAFTRLLMTGNAAPSHSGDFLASPQVSVNPSSNIAADSSSTDTSSLSRHSIFESGLDPTSETPRTSTEETRNDDPETPVFPNQKQLKKSKPPLPKPRHSKSAQQVSEPSLGLSGTFAPAAVSAETPRKDLPTPPTSRKPGQPSKPLPAPPPTTFSTSRPEADSSGGDDVYKATQPVKSDSMPTRPTLPSQGSSQTTPSRSSTSRMSMIQSSPESLTTTSTGAPKSDRAPPPPPTRRSGHRSQAFASEQSSIQSASSSPSIKPVAAEPADVFAQPLSRSASTSSRSQMPPPPPPRRRRGSSKSSLEGPRVVTSPSPRTSLEYSSSQPLSPPAREDVTPYSSRSSRDVLAEMSALQEEVDALRAQYGKPG